MVKVKITITVITSQYGTLQAGDILATSDEFAKHLVTDCNAAEYLEVKSEIKQEITQPIKHGKKG